MKSIIGASAVAFVFLSTTLQANPPKRLPSEWLADQQKVWHNNGVNSTWILPDVLEVTWPATNEKSWYSRLSEEPYTRQQWRHAAYAGRRWPAPRRPLDRLAFGAMLYDSYPRKLAEQSGRPYGDVLQDIFSEFRSLGLNSVVLCTYMQPDEWPTVEAAARVHDLKVIIQYHNGYVRPERGPHYYRTQTLPRGEAMVKAIQGSERLLAYTAKEEIYLPALAHLQTYYATLRERCGDFPIYTLYNQQQAILTTGEPAPTIAGVDQYPFLGGYYGGGRQKPSFMTPQRALNYQLRRRLEFFRQGAMQLEAVFTYTPDMQPGMWVLTEEEMREKNIPLIEYPGVEALDNGNWLLWRRYQAPPNALRAAVWLSAALGAQGWFPWYYTPKMPDAEPVPTAPTKPYRADSSRDGATASRIWQEYAATVTELHSLEPILLRLRPDGFPRFQTDEEWLTGDTLRIIDAPGHVVAVVNLDVGRWPDYPRLDFNRQNLDVDRLGRLTGYEPLREPREATIRLRLFPDEIAASLPDGRLLETRATGNGSWHEVRISIEPGSAALLYTGTAVNLPKMILGEQ